MANTNSDLTEEDAADLQFPKDFVNVEQNSQETCKNCSCNLEAPYILCNQCTITLCLLCFSNGVELNEHKNDHNYRVIRDDFILFSNSNWTAKEELTMLEALFNNQNWNLIARALSNRKLSEIKEHYDYFYLDRKGSSLLPKIPENDAALFPDLVVPYRFRITDKDDPPRYTLNTMGFKHLAGYNPARSDFESEFDRNAEDLLTTIKPIEKNDPYFTLLSNLQCGIFSSYNRRLKERMRWKRIIQKHGLIAYRKINAWLHRYDLTITKLVYEKLIRFMQFCTPFQFEFLMEGLHRSGELKIQILRLCDLHQKGIKSLAEAHLYLHLKDVHEKCESELKTYHHNSNLNWKNRKCSFIIPGAKKKSGFSPIEIIGLPGFEKLSTTERDLCRNVRLVPITYLELKDLLIAENKKMGSLKLKTARKMLKIDVNKTRRIYDFLVNEGFINKADS